MGTILKFEELPLWKESMSIAIDIYTLSNNQYFRKDFDLRNQMRRASISISSNIAEGFERGSNKDFVRFLIISKASCGEIRSQLFLAKSLHYLEDEDYNKLQIEILAMSKKLGGFIKYLMKLNSIKRI